MLLAGREQHGPTKDCLRCFSINKTCCQETWAHCWWICHETHTSNRFLHVSRISLIRQETSKIYALSNLPKTNKKKQSAKPKSRRQAGVAWGCEPPINSHSKASHFNENPPKQNYFKWWKQPSPNYTLYIKTTNAFCVCVFFLIQPFRTRSVDTSVVLQIGSVSQAWQSRPL